MANIRASLYLTAAISILTAAHTATAQINPFSRNRLITDDDLQLIEAASSKLYKVDSPQLGTTEQWSNSNSGNAGSVTLTQVFEQDGMPCRKLLHRITVKGEQEPAMFVFNRCRVKSGEWKLL
jgi:surface antigen